MARYYEITLTPTAASLSASGGVAQQGRVFTSYPNGKNDPGALNVQLDLLSSTFAVPMGNSTISIDGIALADILEAQQFAGMQIVVKGGMQAGLPLANPSQAGVLLRGQIFQSFGNWVATDMNLNFVIVPSTYTFANPGNFVLNWKPGQSLADALAATLNAAYPGVARIMNIRDYVTNAPKVAYYHTLPQFARWLKSATKSKTSSGVDIAILNNGQIFVSDGSVKGTAVQLAFTDLVGQPKWVDQNQMQFSTVMRADIQVGSYVLMPVGLQNAPGIVQTAAASLPSSLKYKTSFQGQFVIQSVRHIGNFREPDGTQWVTIYQAAPQNVG